MVFKPAILLRLLCQQVRKQEHTLVGLQSGQVVVLTSRLTVERYKALVIGTVDYYNALTDMLTKGIRHSSPPDCPNQKGYPAVKTMKITDYLQKTRNAILRIDYKLLLPLFLLSVAQTIWRGYQFGIGNHSIQISILKHYLDASLYPNDAMLATAPHFVTFFFMFAAVLVKLFGHIETIFFIFHILTQFLILVAIYYLGTLIFEDGASAVIGVFLMLPSKILLGAGLIHWTHLTHTFFVLPYILFSIYFFLKNRYILAYALLGISFNINCQSAAFVFPMFALVSLLQLKERNWRDVTKELGVFFLCASPTLVWLLVTMGGPLTDEWMEQLRARSNHHSFPFTWSKQHYSNYLLFVGLGILTWIFALSNSAQTGVSTNSSGNSIIKNKDMHRKIGLFALTVAIMCTMAVVFAEWIPVKLVLRSQLFRSTKFLTIFILIYASYYIRQSWEKGIAHKIAALGTFLALFFSAYYQWLFVIIALYLILDARKISPWALFPVASILVFYLFVPHYELPSSLDFNSLASLIQTFLENKFIVLILCLFILLKSFGKQPRLEGNLSALSMRWLYWLTIVVTIGVMFGYILPSIYKGYHPPLDERGNWIKMQVWVKENTPKDALFITPPYHQSFRIFSERGMVGDWKDGTQQYFHTAYSYDWWERMQDLGGGGRQFDNFNKDQILSVANKYGASYLVFPKSKKLDLTKVYENQEFTVYKLPSEN